MSRLYAVLGTVLLVAACGSFLHAEESIEYRVKAGCLFKFLQFAEWPRPATAEAPFIIGILGDDPFGETLDALIRGRQVDGRKVVVQRYREAPAAREAHVLFVGIKGSRLGAALAELEGAPVLTVGESNSFIKSGGMVRFVIRDEKVSFNVHAARCKASGLKLGAQLLGVSKIVDDSDE